MIQLIREEEPEKIRGLCEKYHISVPEMGDGRETGDRKEVCLTAWRISVNAEEAGLLTAAVCRASGTSNLLSLYLERRFRKEPVIKKALEMFLEDTLADPDFSVVIWRFFLNFGNRNVYTLMLDGIQTVCYEDRLLAWQFRLSSERILTKKRENPAQVEEKMAADNHLCLKPIGELSREEVCEIGRGSQGIRENLTFITESCDPFYSVIIFDQDKEKTVGWILVALRGEEEAQIRRAYVYPEYRGLKIWISCFGLQIRRLAEQFPILSFQVERDNEKMFRVMYQYFSDSLIGITEEHSVTIRGLCRNHRGT